MWVNEGAWEDHKVGRKHKKKVAEKSGFPLRPSADNFTCTQTGLRIKRRDFELEYGEPLSDSQWAFAREVLATRIGRNAVEDVIRTTIATVRAASTVAGGSGAAAAAAVPAAALAAPAFLCCGAAHLCFL